jgi:hypothetical protein
VAAMEAEARARVAPDSQAATVVRVTRRISRAAAVPVPTWIRSCSVSSHSV